MTDRTSRRLRRMLPATVAALAFLAAVPATAAAEPLDPDPLNQTIDSNQAQGTRQVVLDRGHIDFGPTLNTGEFILEIHDDTVAPSLWRQLDDVVVRVSDAAILPVPEDPAYGFLGLPAGTPVHVIHQTQQTDVAWMGWNTQEPQFMSAVTGGVTLSLQGVQGPGDVVVYLQNGNFGAPDILWDTHAALPQDSWVEVNTHTHANWTFSEPGVYLAELKLTAETLAGEPISTDGVLRFAVGDSTDAAEAFAAVYAETSEPGQATEKDEVEAAPESTDDSTAVIVGVTIGAVVLALVIAIAIILITGRRARRIARERRAAEATP